MKTVKLCMAGFGNIGETFARLLTEKEKELAENFDASVLITGVCTKSRGALLNENGIDMKSALFATGGKRTFAGLKDAAPNIRVSDMLQKAKADVFVELTPLSIKDGEPATSYIKEALSRKTHVITANKGPVAWACDELKNTARAQGVEFLHEAAVLGGAPVFNMARFCLRGCEILSLRGILNTTTNFILGELEKSGDFASALAEAQRRGIAEADPSMDIDGFDGAAKVCALANALMGARVTPDKAEITPLGQVGANEIKEAASAGERVKYICRAMRGENGVLLRVAPERVSPADPLCAVNGSSSALVMETDLLGELFIIKRATPDAPNLLQIAYGLYADLLTVISGER